LTAMPRGDWRPRLPSWLRGRTPRADTGPRPEYRAALPPYALRGELARTPLRALTWVVFDTETTGLEPSRDEIVSIAGVRVRQNQVLFEDSFVQLVHPQRTIPASATRIHGIGDDDVKDQPPLRDVLPRFRSFVGDSILAGHNVAFDLAFLQAKQPGTGIRFDLPAVCLLVLSAFLFPETDDHSLDAIARRLDLPLRGRHTAIGDALLTAEALVQLLPRAEERGLSTFGALMAQTAMTSSLRAAGAMFGR
jgi:DNA polymerase III subunit epsilon